LDPNVIKSWTGGERQSVKGMYESERSVIVQSKIVLCTNHPPRYDDASGRMDRRMVVIPFNNRIPDTKRVLGYDDLLVKEEGVGIFRWLVEGARRYFAEVLAINPEAISKASTVAKGDNNSLAAFVSECIEEGGSVSPRSSEPTKRSAKSAT
jgi:putative DNA primase/helicase